ncbi:hypothetical protein CAEBREN_29477 [Caenorhabditis brenneri]|uniref:Uncharacterized protein n=1 Tax=Caenorhabditis brenneri TaxID=135651 RepID=G0NZ68_CAEBE|nr:hypothetical protein CAEBREN_29477 [Caenorhabditis brenneri]
MKWIKNGWK